MPVDDETIQVYNARSSDYAKITTEDAKSPELGSFIAALPAGSLILDLGCGPGHMAKVMQDAGHRVDAVDASPDMVQLACDSGVKARIARFEEVSGQNLYDGIWASFSLLHAPRDAFPDLITQLTATLKPGGLFYIAMKLGDGEHRDSIGRLYSYFTEDELLSHLQGAGLVDPQITRGSSIGLSGEEAQHITITLRKPQNA